MNKQTQAQRVAVALNGTPTPVVIEIRRLEAVNAQLLEALTKCISLLRLVGQEDSLVVESGEAAIKTAKGEA
jgi:hypothetical protein